MWAISKGIKELIQYILNFSPVVTHECLSLETFHGDSVLIKASKLGFLDTINLLLEKALSLDLKENGFSLTYYVNMESSRGKTALIEAACNNQIEVVRILLSYHASPVCRTKVHNLSALKWAEKLRKEEIINELFIASNTENQIRTLFQLIARGKRDEVKSIVSGGERYRLNHINVLQKELKYVEQQLKSHPSKQFRAYELQETKKEWNDLALRLSKKNNESLRPSFSVLSSRLMIIEQEMKEDDEQRITLLRTRTNLLEKLDNARMMSFFTSSGHNLLSWACALGDVDIIKELLENGANFGLGDDYICLCAKIIQTSYRNYRWKKLNGKLLSKDLSKRDMVYKFSMAVMKRKLFLKKASRRSPLCEAFFNGNGHILDLLQKMDIPIGIACLPSYCMPSGNIPRPLVSSSFNLKYINEFSFLDCAYLGKELFQTSTWIPGIGWMETKEDVLEKYAQTVNTAEQLKKHLMLEKKDCHNKKKAKKRQKELDALTLIIKNKMEQAINDGNFEEIVLCAKQGVSINFETEQGVTPLMRAASEDTESLNITIRCKNQAEEQISAVSFLLDRLENRPFIEYQSRTGHTALSYACFHGRLRAVKELLERGAVINQVVTSSRLTPLMVAAMKGKTDICNFLIDNGADYQAISVEGKSAFDFARECDATDILTILENARRCIIRRAHAGKNLQHTLYPCKWGCGTFDTDQNLKKSHEKECEWRWVVCKYCNIKNILAKNRIEHETNICKMRPIECVLCKEIIALNDLSLHSRKHCSKRLISCPLCMQNVEASKMKKHMRLLCNYRKIPCRYSCEHMIPKAFQIKHEREECRNRPARCLRCNDIFQVKDKIIHEKFQCPEREVKCEYCGIFFKINQMNEHNKACLKAFVQCTNSKMGCVWNGPRRMLKKHLSVTCSYEFTKLCPLECGLKLRNTDIKDHMKSSCSKRDVMCVFCCETLVFASVDSHLKFNCIMKVPRKLQEMMSRNFIK